MNLPDINVLIGAHRPESPYHGQALSAVNGFARGLAPFALCSFVASGFIRIVTNPRIFAEPTPLKQAVAFLDELMTLEHCRMVEPAGRHWTILKALINDARPTGNLVSDAYLAAIAVENGCEIVTFDADFLKFRELKCVKL